MYLFVSFSFQLFVYLCFGQNPGVLFLYHVLIPYLFSSKIQPRESFSKTKIMTQLSLAHSMLRVIFWRTTDFQVFIYLSKKYDNLLCIELAIFTTSGDVRIKKA